MSEEIWKHIYRTFRKQTVNLFRIHRRSTFATIYSQWDIFKLLRITMRKRNRPQSTHVWIRSRPTSDCRNCRICSVAKQTSLGARRKGDIIAYHLKGSGNQSGLLGSCILSDSEHFTIAYSFTSFGHLSHVDSSHHRQAAYYGALRPLIRALLPYVLLPVCPSVCPYARSAWNVIKNGNS